MKTKSRAEYQKAWREKKKNDPSYVALTKEKAKKRNKKYLEKLKENDELYNAYLNKIKLHYKKMNPLENFSHRLSKINQVSRENNVKNYITEEQLKNILLTQKCYLTGIKISEDLINHKSAYYLDRIGKKEHGGNGIKGGDYTLDNVKACIFKVNELRDTLGLSAQQAQILFYPARIYFNINKIVNKIKKIFKIV